MHTMTIPEQVHKMYYKAAHLAGKSNLQAHKYKNAATDFSKFVSDRPGEKRRE